MHTKSALVGIFDDRFEAERAVSDLQAAGFKDDQIGYAIRGADVGQGGMITDTVGTKDGRGLLAGAATGAIGGGLLAAAITAFLPGVGPIISAGMLATFLGFAGAGAAVGGLLGAFTGLGYSEDEAKYYESHFKEGKAIVAVKTSDRVVEAQAILARHGAYGLERFAESPLETEGTLSQP